MKKSEVHEVLVTLYLRLNGYFTTGLIVHSGSWGNARTEIDCLAIRHPNHEQPERGLKTDLFLNPPKKMIDLLLCEVKSNPQHVYFNESIRTNREALHAALRWTGVFTEEQVISVAARLQPLFQADVSAKEASAGIIEGSCRVRPLLCCPPSRDPIGDRWCLTGSEIFPFINKCFNPPERRVSCSTQYDFNLWGYPFASIVQHFKDGPNAVTSESLYQHLRATES